MYYLNFLWNKMERLCIYEATIGFIHLNIELKGKERSEYVVI